MDEESGGRSVTETESRLELTKKSRLPDGTMNETGTPAWHAGKWTTSNGFEDGRGGIWICSYQIRVQ